MASDPQPPAGGESPQRPGEASVSTERVGSADDANATTERVGPLRLQRHRKDDGRALLIFTRVEPAAAADETRE